MKIAIAGTVYVGLLNKISFSVGKINYVLKFLFTKGFIKAERFITSKNK